MGQAVVHSGMQLWREQFLRRRQFFRRQQFFRQRQFVPTAGARDRHSDRAGPDRVDDGHRHGNGHDAGSSSTGGAGDSSGRSTLRFGQRRSLSSTQTFGGGGIIGFSPASPKQSILTYKKKNHYNEWEFLYSPLVDQMRQGGNAGTIGQPAGGSNNGFGGTGTGFGGTGTSNGIGGGFSTNPGGSAPTAPTTPAAPQQ